MRILCVYYNMRMQIRVDVLPCTAIVNSKIVCCKKKN